MQRVHRGQVLKARDVNSLRSRGTFARGVFDSVEGVVQRSRRVVGTPGEAGTPIRNAFCKNDAGGGKYIQVYLDTNLTGEQVYVECTLIGATDLSQCFPTLTEGVRIPVWFDSTHWRCLWWFQGYDVCAEPEE